MKNFPKFPNLSFMEELEKIRGDCLEIDIKDDDTEEFFKSRLLRVSGYCSVSPLIKYGSSYMVRCKADQQV